MDIDDLVPIPTVKYFNLLKKSSVSKCSLCSTLLHPLIITSVENTDALSLALHLYADHNPKEICRNGCLIPKCDGNNNCTLSPRTTNSPTFSNEVDKYNRVVTTHERCANDIIISDNDLPTVFLPCGGVLEKSGNKTKCTLSYAPFSPYLGTPVHSPYESPKKKN